MLKDKYFLSAFADEYEDDIDKQIEILVNNNFDNIELRFIDGISISTIDDNKLFEIKSKLDKANIKVSSIGSPLGKISLDDDFLKHLDTCKRVFEIASFLNAKYVRIFSFYPHSNMAIEESKDEVIDKLSKMIELANKYNLILCHENEAKIYGESPSRCLELLDYFKGKLKCVFDMGNFVLDGFNPLDAYELLKNHIAYFHIKDALYEGAIVPAGLGKASIKEILTKYSNEFNLKTYITLEPHLQTFSGLNALVGKKFENPYKYETKQAAFIDAIAKLKELLK